jgi:hypothetical protein
MAYALEGVETAAQVVEEARIIDGLALLGIARSNVVSWVVGVISQYNLFVTVDYFFLFAMCDQNDVIVYRSKHRPNMKT